MTTTPNYGFTLPAVNSAVDEDLWGDELNANWSAIDTDLKTVSDTATAALAGIVPAGAILSYGGSSAPSGWLLCYGQSVLRADYAALFTAIGTSFGSADGTHFNLPDLRGRVPAGKDDMGGSAANRITNAVSGFVGTTIGAAGGSQSHTLVTAEIPSHTHTTSLFSSGSGSTYPNVTGSGSTGARDTGCATGSTGGGGAHRNVQPTQITTYIIKT